MLKVNRDCCDAVAGNTRAGKFLHQLVFWLNSTKAPVFNGHRWAAFTREQWAAKTGLTVDQIRRILIRLAADKLILCEQHKFGGKVPNFIRLTPECIEALCAAQVAQKCAAQVAQKCVTLLDNLKEITVEKKQAATGSAVASPEQGCISQVSGYPEEDGKIIPFPLKGQGGPGSMATANEIAASILASAKKPIDTLKPDKVDSLIDVWREHSKGSGKMAPHFTMKMRGQLKHLIKIWPEQKAPKILACALSNWYEFTEAAEAVGAFKSPPEPELSYLVKFQHAAVTLFLKSTLKAKVTKSAPAVTKPAVQSIAQPSVLDDKPMTWEELQAMEAAEQKVAS